MKLANIFENNYAVTALLPVNSLSQSSLSIGASNKPKGFQDFIVNLKQSLMAYAFNIFGIVAGSVVAYFLGVFQTFPWAFVVYPPILSSRGVIGGLFCGRLSTGLHLGTIKPSFRRNTRSFCLLLHAIVVSTLEASTFMGVIAAFIFAWSQRDLIPELFFNVLIVVVSTMALSLVVISPLALIASFLSFKHGLDPDIVLYPVESTIADFLITFLYVGVLNVFALNDFAGKYLLLSISLILLFFTVYFILKDFREEEFVKTLKETLLTIILVSFIINIAGTAFGKIAESVEERREIYTVYPALIDTIGDVGAVVGSTATTKLALGILKPSFSSIKNHYLEILSAWVASIIMYCIYSTFSLIIQGVFTLANFLSFTTLLLFTNLIAALSIIMISYAVAILTYKKGFDPDNFEIPIESSLADSITSIALLISLLIIG
ncbi:MAG: magnesium transporter [Thermoproteota archaeon]|nr:magnesium transporter [Candidatus Brockarchaeota archaeon]